MACTLQAPCGGVLWVDQWHQDHKEDLVPAMARCLNGHTFLSGEAQVLVVKPKPEKSALLCYRHKQPRPCPGCQEHWQKYGPAMNEKRRRRKWEKEQRALPSASSR